jgi:hypothetical protein
MLIAFTRNKQIIKIGLLNQRDVQKKKIFNFITITQIAHWVYPNWCRRLTLQSTKKHLNSEGSKSRSWWMDWPGGDDQRLFWKQQKKKKKKSEFMKILIKKMSCFNDFCFNEMLFAWLYGFVSKSIASPIDFFFYHQLKLET